MQVDITALKEQYRLMETEALVDLYQANTLTETAETILADELNGRNIPLPEKIVPVEHTRIKQPFIRGFWRGEKPLIAAFWGLGFFGLPVIVILSALITFGVHEIYTYFSAHQNRAIMGFTFIFSVNIFFIFTFVSVWRCSGNTRLPFWGNAAKFYMTILAVEVFIYSTIPLLRI